MSGDTEQPAKRGCLPAYVSRAHGDEVVINNAEPAVFSDLTAFEISQIGANQFLCKTPAEQDKAQLFQILRDNGVAFSAGREWCPSDVFQHLREASLISGTYSEIFWKSPGEWSTREV